MQNKRTKEYKTERTDNEKFDKEAVQQMVENVTRRTKTRTVRFLQGQESTKDSRAVQGHKYGLLNMQVK